MSTVMFSWGANSYGQLAQGNCEDSSLPKVIRDLPHLKDQDKVSEIVGGGGHTLLLTEQGSLYTCGWNSRGQLGIGHQSNAQTFELVSSLEDIAVCTVAAGWDFSLAITSTGKLLTWGSNRYGQLGIPSIKEYVDTPTTVDLSDSIVGVAAGLRHSLILSESGQVFACGSAKKGQLGHCKDHCNPSEMTIGTFTKMDLSSINSKVIEVAAGAYHSALLTESGEVFICGCNRHGQLGPSGKLLEQSAHILPVPVGSFQNKPIKSIHCGWDFMLALSENGCAFTWGRGSYGQLGRIDTVQQSCPAPIADDFTLQAIVCGSEHCLATSDLGTVLSWGWNEHGICGTGDQHNITRPRPVPSLAHYRASLIGCGAGHSFAICDDVQVTVA